MKEAVLMGKIEMVGMMSCALVSDQKHEPAEHQ